MSNQNITVVKQTLDSFLAGDIPGLIERLTPDVVWDHSGPAAVPHNRVYNGRDDLMNFFQSVDETLETLAFEPKEYFVDGDTVVTLGHFRWKVKANGNEFASDFAMRFGMKNGLVAHWSIIFDRGGEAAAFEG